MPPLAIALMDAWLTVFSSDIFMKNRFLLPEEGEFLSRHGQHLKENPL